MNIRSFCEVTWDDFQNNIFKAIDKEIDNCKDDYEKYLQPVIAQ